MERVSKQEAVEFLKSQLVAHLGTVIDDRPYVTPMSFVIDDERMLFRTLAGAKLDAIQSNPNVCIEVSTYDSETGDWMSVIVNGEAHLLDDAAIRQSVVAHLYEKYRNVMGSPFSRGSDSMPLRGQPVVVEVPMTEVTGMSSGRGMTVRTKPGRI